MSRGHHSQEPWILGISASHNGAACLLKGSEIIVAIQEERITRRKRQRIFAAQPARAIDYCLGYAGIEANDLDLVAVSVHGSPSAAEHDVSNNPLLKNEITHRNLPVLNVSHHMAHAASAFATSGFETAEVLVIDGSGSLKEDLPEFERECIVNVAGGAESVSFYSANGPRLAPLEKHLTTGPAWLQGVRDQMPFFHSLGGMYSAVASQIFGDVHASGQVMGLAPYGRPIHPPSDFFDIVDDTFVFSSKLPKLFTTSARWPENAVAYQDLACSVQVALEEAVLHLARRLRRLGSSENLCYAGGVALNSVANERIIRESGFRDVHIVPAAEDSGCALGAAYRGLWKLTEHYTSKRIQSDSTGRTYTRHDVEAAVSATPGVEVFPSENICGDAAQLLADGHIIGWFSGGSELGPRALGHRSILCDPRPHDAKARLNARVKKREVFRPFAPAVLEEEAQNWFELGPVADSHYMLRVCEVKASQRHRVPAIVHVDQTARPQTVSKQAHARLHALISEFDDRTGVPILLNTSFNIKGMPIVESPHDALQCMLATDIDYCILEDLILRKRMTILIPESITPNAHWPESLAGRNVLLDQYVPAARLAGFYESTVGQVEIKADDADGLLARWAGQALPLKRVHGTSFEVASMGWAGCRVEFSVDDRSAVRHAVLTRPAQSDIALTPTCTMRSTQTLSDIPLGSYELANIQLFVRQGSAKPQITGSNLSTYSLEAAGDGSYVLVNTPGFAVAFERGEGGYDLLVKQPNGCYRLKPVT